MSKKPVNKKNLLIAVAAIVAVLAAYCGYQKFSKSDSEKEIDPAKVIISKYSGGKVTLKDVNNELAKLVVRNEKLQGITFDQLNSDQKEALVKEVVLNEIIYKEAKRRNLDDNKDYKEALKIFETELLKQSLFTDLVNNARDEENVKEKYDELVKDMKDKQDFKVSYIALKKESDANSLYERLSKNTDSFAYQAKLRSIDKDTAKNSGELGFVFEDSLPKQIVEQIKTLEKDQISKPISVAQDRWIIVRFEDKRPAEIAPFDKAKDSLAQNLASQAVNDFVSQSLEEAEINMIVR